MHSSGSIDPKPFLTLHHISKRFGALWANRDISLDLYDGEIHAIVGENGAGKSTLMKILNGHLQPDSGEIRLHGRALAFSHPRDAMHAGIGMAYQQFLIFPQLTALENVIVGSEPGGDRLVKRKQAKDELLTLCRSVGFDLPLDAMTLELSFAHRQQIEILRLLYRKVKTLILDEPTSLLSPPETERFLALLKSLRAEGHTILLVSHKLKEVFAVADRVSVLSRGKLVGSYPRRDIAAEELVQQVMFGAPDELAGIKATPTDKVTADEPAVGAGLIPARKGLAPYVLRDQSSVLLELKEATTPPGPNEAGLNKFSLNIFQGEIFGLGGVVGNGQRTLALLLSGMLPAESGTIFLSGREITHLPISTRKEMGLRWLPANPVEEALMPSRSIWENLFLGHQRQDAFQHYGWLKQRSIKNWATEQLLQKEVVHAALSDPVSSLSGGNLQKLALSRVLEGRARLIILEQPSRGLDIRAQERLRDEVRQLNARGVTFLLISYDLEELMALSHRLGVLYRGRMMGIVNRDDASPERLGRWMLGIEDQP